MFVIVAAGQAIVGSFATSSIHKLVKSQHVRDVGIVVIWGLVIAVTPVAVFLWNRSREMTTPVAPVALTPRPMPGFKTPNELEQERKLEARRADEAIREHLRAEWGLRALVPVEVGLPWHEVPSGTYFFTDADRVGVYTPHETARAKDDIVLLRPVEVHKDRVGAYFFLLYATSETAADLRYQRVHKTDPQWLKLTLFAHAYEENTLLVRVAMEGNYTFAPRSFQHGYLIELIHQEDDVPS
ncbi:MAG: hypothetical protein JWO37_3458 [Acidimicrobiales bacterium]|nr:hypothetical protein [Acidimicrobiales bacterium]